MRVSLIMPALNEEASIEFTLESIYQQTRLPDEIVVGDGGSTDNTLALLKYFDEKGPIPIIVVNNPDKFCGGGRNVAVDAASGDLFVGMDFGNKAHPNYIENIVRRFEQDPELDYTGGPHYVLADTPFERCYAAALEYWALIIPTIPYDKLLEMAPKDFRPGGMNLAFTRDIYVRSGGFCPWAGSADDVLFGQRLYNMQAKIKPTADAIVYYHMGKDFNETWRRFKNYARWSGRLGLQFSSMMGSLKNYLILLLCFTLGFWWTPAWFIASIGTITFLAKIGPLRCHNISKKTGMTFTKKDWLRTLGVRLVQDAAIIPQWFYGRLERLFDPKWVKLTHAYLYDGRHQIQNV